MGSGLVLLFLACVCFLMQQPQMWDFVVAVQAIVLFVLRGFRVWRSAGFQGFGVDGC